MITRVGEKIFLTSPQLQRHTLTIIQGWSSVREIKAFLHQNC